MKKILALLLVMMLVFSLAACGNDESPSGSDNPSTSNQEQTDNTDNNGNGDSTENDEGGDGQKEEIGSKDGSSETTGIPVNWPDNDYTKLIPTPDVGGKVLSSGENGSLFSIELKWSKDQGLAYAKQLQDAGFGDDCVEKYESSGFIKYTANGVTVELMDVYGTAGLTITKTDK